MSDPAYWKSNQKRPRYRIETSRVWVADPTTGKKSPVVRAIIFDKSTKQSVIEFPSREEARQWVRQQNR